MKRLLLCAALVLFTGCASKNYDYLSSDKSILESKKLTVTPFPHEEYFGGPSSLATLFTHESIEFVYADIVGNTFAPHIKGSLQQEMKETARHYGLIPYEINPNLSAILSEVSNNRPVLVLLNSGLTPLPVWQYTVVTGFNKASKEVFLTGSKNTQTWMSFDTFERLFERGGSWAVVALKPPLLPVASSEKEIILAIADMAQAGYKDHAKQTASNYVTQHPLSFLGAIMLANINYNMHDYLNAAAEYKRALALKPKNPVVMNSLAQSLLKDNKLIEAKLYALASVKAGGAFLAEHQATLEAINHKLQQ